MNCLIFMTLFSYFNTAAEKNKKKEIRFTSIYFCFYTRLELIKKIQLIDLSSKTSRQIASAVMNVYTSYGFNFHSV